MEQNLYDIIKPTRIIVEKAKWDKMRIASLIFIVGFVVTASVYCGYWYATDYQDMKVIKTNLPQQTANGTYCDNNIFCPLNLTLTQILKPKDLNTLISY
jgi:hypothetical protein